MPTSKATGRPTSTTRTTTAKKRLPPPGPKNPPAAGRKGGLARAAKLNAERARDPHSLLSKERRFVEEYLIDGNGTRAARAVGYSVTSAVGIASELLADERVAAAVEDGRARLLADVRRRQQEALDELDLLAHSDVTNYALGDRGELLLLDGAPKGAAKAVASIKFRKRTFIDEEGKETITEEGEIRLWDKNVALTNKMRTLGLAHEGASVDLARDPATATGGGPGTGGGPLALEVLRAMFDAAATTLGGNE